VHTDVSKEEDVKAMVQKAVDTFGRIDYAANVAGVSIILALHDSS